MGRLGLVLSGGGARGAYQAGVMKGLIEIYTKHGIPVEIPVVSGISAGSVNAGFWCANADRPQEAVLEMERLWRGLRVENVYRTDIASVFRNAFRWLWSLGLGGIHRHATAQALLDTSPLQTFLKKHMDAERIKKNLKAGVLDYIAISTTDYSTATSITFVHSEKPFTPWSRYRRKSEVGEVTSELILASCAIPLLFPPGEYRGRYFGDGNLRNNTPLSPAIHLGADKLFIIGVRAKAGSVPQDVSRSIPSIGRVLNVVLNAMLLDSIDTDLERVKRINSMLESVGPEAASKLPVRPVKVFEIYPSADMAHLTRDYVSRLPLLIRYLLKGLGSRRQTEDLISYLMFDGEFCQKLMDMGYADIQAHEDEMVAFLKAD